MTKSEKEAYKRKVAQKLSEFCKEANGDYNIYVELVEEFERLHPKATEYIPRDDNKFWYGAD